MSDVARGLLIAVEGIDGTGKTTQVQMLNDALAAAGEPVVSSKEPTDGRWGRKIRESAVNGRMPLEEELYAFIQDRKEHIEQIIAPNLNKGATVILDRYFYSTIAYQGSRGGNVTELTTRMLDFAPVPDVTFVLDLDPDAALARISEGRKETPNEFERVENLKAVRQIFNQLTAQHDCLKAVDACRPANLVHSTICRVLLETVLKAKYCPQPDLEKCEPEYCSFRLAEQCRWLLLHQSLLG